MASSHFPDHATQLRQAPSRLAEPALAIIIVNWNGWRDVVECLETIFNNKDRRFRVIVCDNASADGSVGHFIDWASGLAPVTVTGQLAHLACPNTPKPLRTALIGPDAPLPSADDADLFIVNTGANLGFAGGNNVGLKIAASWTDCRHFWLLNPDTVIEPDAISILLDRMDEDDKPGMVGTDLRFYHTPDVIQAYNGSRYNKWTGTSRGHFNFYAGTPTVDRAEIEMATDFVSGASLAISKACYLDIGPMNEAYFLYFEEIEWALKARQHHHIGYAQGALAYHKEGTAAGSSSNKGGRSLASERFLLRSKLMFTRDHFPWALPAVYAFTLVQILVRIRRGHFHKAGMMFKLLMGR
ncbi:glycosyltransferase family 2 protein [Pseudokordiimonas caeni]|uniref:glycosyltransferase family 2 protein n=1 Tax=Pseudokordiimonas caeni TaxID=2997908 RepID=UPI002811AA65|nr:glycosyltransferase family 2 protein [Pseudokordiimonas caeni]